MLEVTYYHLNHNRNYADIARAEGFHFRFLKNVHDLYKIPPIPTLYLKKHARFSVDDKNIIVKVTTSGTSGTKSVVGFDVNSGLLDLEMAIRVLSYHQMFQKPLQTILFWDIPLVEIIILGFHVPSLDLLYWHLMYIGNML